MAGKALVVGIDNYENPDVRPLSYAEKDARAIARRLRFHDDTETTPNLHVSMCLNSGQRVTRACLRSAIGNLFNNARGLDVVFYFGGHGYVADTGGVLVTADAVANDLGVTMQELVEQAVRSDASSVVILLDCCHAGDAGNPSWLQNASLGAVTQLTLLRDNMSIMAASMPRQIALEPGGGLFTAAVNDALDGAAADILGEISTTSIYSLVERRFTLWQQRPVLKASLTRPIILRRVKGSLSRQDLRRIVEFFPTAEHRFSMEPDHDPERDVDGVSKKPEVPDKVEIGRLFKRYRDVSLICSSVFGEDLYYVAQRSHTVELTLFGKEYLGMIKRGLL